VDAPAEQIPSQIPAVLVPHARRPRLSPAGWSVVAVAAVLGFWEASTRLGLFAFQTLPPLSSIIRRAVSDHATFLPALVTTTEEALLGFAISLVAGVLIAIAIVTWRPVDKSLTPLIIASQVVPKIAIAPLLLIWFGFGLTPKILVAVALSIFPIIINATLGLRAVAPERIHLARSIGANRAQIFTRVRLPSALPALFSGAKLAAAFSVTGAVVGEFVAPGGGIGYAINLAGSSGDATALWAGILYLSLVGILAFLLISWLERVMIPWHESQRRRVGRVA
jgi:NitT/TauT family transport system permease protein